mgnify:CR=1 FL=1
MHKIFSFFSSFILLLSISFNSYSDNQFNNINSKFAKYKSDPKVRSAKAMVVNQNNGKVIFHNWYRNNKLMSKIRMEIGWSYNWRTWSYINVNNDRTGNWKIVVTDSLNVRYDSLFFNIENTLP